MKRLILLLLAGLALNACSQHMHETERSASEEAQTTASEVQRAHAETITTLDRLNDKIPPDSPAASGSSAVY